MKHCYQIDVESDRIGRLYSSLQKLLQHYPGATFVDGTLATTANVRAALRLYNYVDVYYKGDEYTIMVRTIE